MCSYIFRTDTVDMKTDPINGMQNRGDDTNLAGGSFKIKQCMIIAHPLLESFQTKRWQGKSLGLIVFVHNKKCISNFFAKINVSTGLAYEKLPEEKAAYLREQLLPLVLCTDIKYARC